MTRILTLGLLALTLATPATAFTKGDVVKVGQADMMDTDDIWGPKVPTKVHTGDMNDTDD